MVTKAKRVPKGVRAKRALSARVCVFVLALSLVSQPAFADSRKARFQFSCKAALITLSIAGLALGFGGRWVNSYLSNAFEMAGHRPAISYDYQAGGADRVAGLLSFAMDKYGPTAYPANEIVLALEWVQKHDPDPAVRGLAKALQTSVANSGPDLTYPQAYQKLDAYIGDGELATYNPSQPQSLGRLPFIESGHNGWSPGELARLRFIIANEGTGSERLNELKMWMVAPELSQSSVDPKLPSYLWFRETLEELPIGAESTALTILKISGCFENWNLPSFPKQQLSPILYMVAIREAEKGDAGLVLPSNKYRIISNLLYSQPEAVLEATASIEALAATGEGIAAKEARAALSEIRRKFGVTNLVYLTSPENETADGSLPDGAGLYDGRWENLDEWLLRTFPVGKTDAETQRQFIKVACVLPSRERERSVFHKIANRFGSSLFTTAAGDTKLTRFVSSMGESQSGTKFNLIATALDDAAEAMKAIGPLKALAANGSPLVRSEAQQAILTIRKTYLVAAYDFATSPEGEEDLAAAGGLVGFESDRIYKGKEEWYQQAFPLDAQTKETRRRLIKTLMFHGDDYAIQEIARTFGSSLFLEAVGDEGLDRFYAALRPDGARRSKFDAIVRGLQNEAFEVVEAIPALQEIAASSDQERSTDAQLALKAIEKNVALSHLWLGDDSRRVYGVYALSGRVQRKLRSGQKSIVIGRLCELLRKGDRKLVAEIVRVTKEWRLVDFETELMRVALDPEYGLQTQSESIMGFSEKGPLSLSQQTDLLESLVVDAERPSSLIPAKEIAQLLAERATPNRDSSAKAEKLLLHWIEVGQSPSLPLIRSLAALQIKLGPVRTIAGAVMAKIRTTAPDQAQNVAANNALIEFIYRSGADQFSDATLIEIMQHTSFATAASEARYALAKRGRLP
jgi:hypothetical protein